VYTYVLSVQTYIDVFFSCIPECGSFITQKVLHPPGTSCDSCYSQGHDKRHIVWTDF